MAVSASLRRWLGVAIVTLYLLLATLYALQTPPWQAPDEPAHYNYARHIAEMGRLPILEPGDYPAAYLEACKAARFAPSFSIDRIKYESHQPPLYYTLASLVYRAASGQPIGVRLRAMRLLSVLLGAAALALIYACACRLLPERPWLAAAVGLVCATLPMHLTMTAAVNSDALAELLIVLIGFLVLRRRDDYSLRYRLLLGLLLGLAFLTKMQTYTAFGFCAVALLCDARDQKHPWPWLLRNGATILAIAVLVAAPWIWRNMQVYGWNDPLAMIRHDQVVQGQLTTSAFLAQYGLAALLRGLLQTTFHSFWGQFGWMAAPMHPRVYQVLGGVSGLSLAGLIVWLWRGGWRNPWSDARRESLILLAWVAITAAGYLWWNLSYVQHQGRYLFPALLPIALGLMLGLDQAAQNIRPVLVSLAVVAVLLLAVGLFRGDLPGFTLALVVIAGGGLVAARWLGQRRPELLLALTGAGMTAFAAFCLWGYVVPFLTP